MPSKGTHFIIVEPDPASLVESLRAFGYSLETAIADLVDNSITAGSQTVSLGFDWCGPDTRITLTDDGCGMTESALTQAMRMGSTSPIEQRAAHDLGRFGLGLKTASFSQCRQLTVLSKPQGGDVHLRQWNLDQITAAHEWRLATPDPESYPDLAERLRRQTQGTVVVWESLDRVVATSDKDDEGEHRRFLERAQAVKAHLEMTFHRFLARSHGMQLLVNGRPAHAWDPFLTRHEHRQVLPEETLTIRGRDVEVRPFVLPHRSRLDDSDFQLAGGQRGWNDLQGFYVYRNRRLLVAGDWLGLNFTKDEHYKLARIQIDIGNDMDQLWQIDVRKSRARPPPALRDDLRRIAKVTRTRAEEVYRHRGKIVANQAARGLVPMWLQKVRGGKLVYHLNRDHPLAQEAVRSCTESAIKTLLRVIEETVPVPLISISHAERPEAHAAPFDGPTSEVVSIARQVYQALRAKGSSHVEARDTVLRTDPFQYFPQLYESLGAEED